MKKQITNYKIILGAIAGIVVLEAIALFNGINGVLLTTVIAVIAGLAGWTLPTPKLK